MKLAHLSFVHRAAVPVLLAHAIAGASLALPQTVVAASVSTAGEFGNQDSSLADLTPDGRYLVFTSLASNFIGNDGNGRRDIFRRDLVMGTTELVTFRLNNVGPPDGHSNGPNVSADGRFVAFQSDATTLIAGDTNGVTDIFVRDMVLGVTERISVTGTGAEASLASTRLRATPDLRYIVFSAGSALLPSDTNGDIDVYRYDRATGGLELVSVSSAGTSVPGYSFSGAISESGRYVVFESSSNVLVPGDTNPFTDLFLRDMVAGTTQLVTLTSQGSQIWSGASARSVSEDGSKVLFVSADAFDPTDTDGEHDVYLRDLGLGTTTLMSASQSGANPPRTISGGSWMSADGRHVLFSGIDPYVPSDTNNKVDAYVRDLERGTIERISLSSTGAELDENSAVSAFTPGLGTIAFISRAGDVTPGSPSGFFQLFARRRGEEVGTSYCAAVQNSTGVSGVIRAFGSRVVAANDLRLDAVGLPRFSFGMFLASRTQDLVPMAGGSAGNLCLGGAIGRFSAPGQIQSVGPAGNLSLTVDVGAIPQPTAFVPALPGETWNFQTWFREPSAGPSSTNYTDGLAIQFE